MFYGVLPRFLLQQWLAVRFRNTLKKDIASSGEVERFLNGCQRVTSNQAAAVTKPDNTQKSMRSIELGSADYSFIGWQKSLHSDNVAYQLGLSSWQQDVQWIENSAAAIAKPIIILVKARQTPTGELADCIELLREQGKEPSIGLVEEESNDSPSGALLSWQYFAQQHNLELSSVVEARHV